MKNSLTTIIFWGAAWGLTEATLGYALHLLPYNFGWMVWFPLAYYFIDRAYKKTGSAISILYTSFIAASIKLVNLFMPTRIDRVLNPAASILLEGLAIFVVYVLIEKKEDLYRYKFLEVLTYSIGWRILYTIYILFMPPFFFSVSAMRESGLFFRFLITESFATGLIVYIYIKVSERVSEYSKMKKDTERASMLSQSSLMRATLSLSILALAIYAQWVL